MNSLLHLRRLPLSEVKQSLVLTVLPLGRPPQRTIQYAYGVRRWEGDQTANSQTGAFSAS